MRSKLKTILAFAERGVGIVLLEPKANSSAVAGGAKAAVIDPQTLRKFYRKHPDYNYGLALGDGLFVVRANNNRAKSRLCELAAEHGKNLRKTVTLRIENARLHLFVAKGLQVGTSRIEEGIDVLGAGEYVPGPGSRLPSGGESRFAVDHSLSDVADANAAIARSASKVGNDAGNQRVTPKAAPSPGPSGDAPDLDARPAAAETGVKEDTERVAGMALASSPSSTRGTFAS
jgi:Bifunctional DNA primase/polymerase, N-terminal